MPRFVACSAFVFAFWLACGHASLRAETRSDGTSSRSARKEAQSEIPYDQLSAESQQLIRRVLKNTTVYRRMPTRVLACDPELHRFLVNQPDVLVNIWERLAAGRLPPEIHLAHLKQESPDRFLVDDGHGTTGEIRYLYRDANTQLIYADGVYEGPMFLHRVQGRCLLLLRSNYFRDLGGQAFATCRLDAFIQLDQPGVHVVAKTFQPLVGKVADQSFVEGTAFLEALSRVTASNPRAAERMVQRLDNVRPEVRDEFTAVAYRVHTRSGGLMQASPAAAQATITDRPARAARAQSD